MMVPVQAFPEEALRVATYSAVSTESRTALHGLLVWLPKYWQPFVNKGWIFFHQFIEHG